MSQLPAIILAGGLSSRMGRPKALERIAGERLIDRVARIVSAQAGPVILNSNDPEIAVPGLPVVPDAIDGRQGPMAGIAAGLAAISQLATGATHALVVPVDCPFLPDDLAETLLTRRPGKDDIVLASSRGQTHPVVSLWPVSAGSTVADWLAGGQSRKMWAFLEGRAVTIHGFDDRTLGGQLVDPFFNVNTPDDLAFARMILEQAE